MRILLIILFFCLHHAVKAQELFVYTEPASNMAAKSVGIRMNNMLMKNKHTGKNEYHLIPEVMFGISKKVMIHMDAFFSNVSGKFNAEGASVYAKYRFYSIDDIHSHFRMAAFGRYSLNDGLIHDASINLYGTNSGYEGGIVATQLVQKIALSANASVVHAFDNGKYIFADDFRNAFNYSFSIGKLMLPADYTSYKQTNVNLMVELLGQTNLGRKFSYLDLAPSLQMIFNSRARVDIGYRFPLTDKFYRSMERGVLLRVEYNFFNAY
ncbi:hypothetical protein LK994_13735 [Ferruginibacter lapsinanis]|uniref:hypothetical protein n=1 Tax=Ferruginibacter lapsinanis TaxID=563172 RepID=UPI001E2F00AE|nr:hypothetical protein [Ferruginibacter lapsinanis]UEG49698.1 hypothetical protein LK994_13735 [Ferruginibacter lapsinanis]